MNMLAIFLAALVPMAVGFVWYNPKVLGTAWMQAADVTEEKMKGANMGKIFGLAFLFSVMLAFIFPLLVVHQVHVMSLLTNQADSADPNSEASLMLKKFNELFGTSYRTFKHGAFHGTLAGIFIALPILGTNALFERRSFKYIAINAGYWIVSMGLMGGVICAFS